MELAVRLLAALGICAGLCAALKKELPAHTAALAALGAALAVSAVLTLMEPALAFAEQLRDLAGLESAALGPLMKALAIGALTGFVSSICEDCGQKTLAGAAQLCGTVAAVYVTLPLAGAVLQLLRELTGG